MPVCTEVKVSGRNAVSFLKEIPWANLVRSRFTGMVNPAMSECVCEGIFRDDYEGFNVTPASWEAEEADHKH